MTFSDAALHSFKKGISVAFSPKRDVIALGGGDSILLFELSTDKQVSECTGLDKSTRQLAFSNDGKRIASAHMNGAISVCDVRTGKRLLRLLGEPGDSSGIAFGRRTGELLHAGWGWGIHAWNSATGAATREMPSLGIRRFRFAPRGNLLATLETSYPRSSVSIRRWPSGKETCRFPTFTDAWDLAFSPSGILVVAACVSFALYDPATGGLLARGPSASDRPFYSVACSSDGRFLAFTNWCAATGGKLSIWESRPLRPVAEFETGTGSAFEVAFSKDDTYLAVTAHRKSLVLDFRKLIAG